MSTEENNEKHNNLQQGPGPQNENLRANRSEEQINQGKDLREMQDKEELVNDQFGSTLAEEPYRPLDDKENLTGGSERPPVQEPTEDDILHMEESGPIPKHLFPKDQNENDLMKNSPTQTERENAAIMAADGIVPGDLEQKGKWNDQYGREVTQGEIPQVQAIEAIQENRRLRKENATLKKENENYKKRFGA